MALHIRTVTVQHEGGVLHADLQAVRVLGRGLEVRARLTRRRGKWGEIAMGYAALNPALELVQAPEGLTDSERAALEQAIATLVGPSEDVPAPKKAAK